MKIIKQECSKCHHQEKYKWWEIILNICVSVVFLIGLFTLLVLCVSKSSHLPTYALGPDTFYTRMNGLVVDIMANKDDLVIRDYLIDHIPTLQYCTDDAFCYARQIYQYLDNKHTYMLTGSSTYPIEYILEKDNVQCSNYAYAYCYSVKQFGVHCEVHCNTRHCWSIVREDGKDILVDLTGSRFKVLNNHPPIILNVTLVR